MKNIKDLTYLITQKKVESIARFMKGVCLLFISISIVAITLACMGRLQFSVYSNSGYYERAIYAEDYSQQGIRKFTVFSEDSIYVRTTSQDDKINIFTYSCLVLIFSLNIIPTIISHIFLFNLFHNVQNGKVFIKNNANYLIYYAIINIIFNIICPMIKLLFIQLVNNFLTFDNISISTGHNTVNNIIPSIGFLVAGYIISYGVNLQDEVDQTI